jgi:hypothetical protein
VAARVRRRVVRDVRREVESPVAAVGLKLTHMTAAKVEADLDRVLLTLERQVGDVLKHSFVPENRQRTAVTDARVVCRAENRYAVLTKLLVGVGHTELFSELVAVDDVGLRELEIEVVVAGTRVQQHARREHMDPSENRVLCPQI